jgi:hypothetical protein
MTPPSGRQLHDAKQLLGKRVQVLLSVEGHGADKKVVIEGKLLGFGTGGTFEIEEDDGDIHYCWPMLEIEEVTEDGTEHVAETAD